MSITGFNRRRRISWEEGRVDKSGPYPVMVPLDEPKPSSMRPDQKSGPDFSLSKQGEAMGTPEDQRLRNDDTGDVVQSHNFPPRGMQELPTSVGEFEGTERYQKVRRSLGEAHDARIALEGEKDQINAYHGDANEDAGKDKINAGNVDWTQPEFDEQQSINEPAHRLMDPAPIHTLDHEHPNAAIKQAGIEDAREAGFVDPVDADLPKEKSASHYQKLAEGQDVSEDEVKQKKRLSKTDRRDGKGNPPWVKMAGSEETGVEGDEDARRNQKATTPPVTK